MSEVEPRAALEQLADLLGERNLIDAQISQLIGRPSHPGHIGEFIAAHVFDIALHPSATTKASDGVFRAGPLAGRTVNVKWYSRASTLLDLATSEMISDHADFYLVLAGPKGGPSSRGEVLRWSIEAVYLFDAHELVSEQLQRGVALGIASSVPVRLWQAAMIYPGPVSDRMTLDKRQRALLACFGRPMA